MVDVGIVNYGIGNIKSFYNAYQQLNVSVAVVSSPEELKQAKRLILPGVGAFDWAMTKLSSSGLRPILDEQVLGKGVPVLGICVGMQMMAESSEEGSEPGLGWIDGKVKKFDDSDIALNERPLPLPHMGWNDIETVANHPLLNDLTCSMFYFLHSYYFLPADQHSEIAKCFYGHDFSCGVANRNIVGVQFHPEKSHRYGTKLLKNFVEY
jgi:glutamine amidotransferase